MTGPDLLRRLRSWAARRAGRGAGRLALGVAEDGPGGRPFAEFAGVLDGRHLWLAVADPAPDAALGLRLPDGRVEPLAGTREPAGPSAPPVLAARVDLAALVAAADWADRLPAQGHLALVPVLVTPGHDPEPLWTPPRSLAGRERRTGSLAPGLRPRLRRADDGTLVLELATASRAVRAVAFEAPEGGVDVRVEVAATVTGARVLRGDDGGAALGDLGVVPVPEGVVVRVSPDVPLPAGTPCPVVLDTADGPVRVARTEDDVWEAEQATRLPGVVSADGTWQLRCGWDDTGRLVLVRDALDSPDVDEDDSDAEAVAPTAGAGP